MAKNTKRKGNSAFFAGRSSDRQISATNLGKRISKGSGFVSLVGAGPGDAGLMTVKGLDRLRSADAVVYDSLVNQALLVCNDRALKIDAGKRHKKENSGPYWTQKKINALLIRLARRGKKVVRLKGGDPFIFGRGGEEALALHGAGISFEVVPGVSAASAVPAYAGIPITDRRFASQVTLITGHEDPLKPESSIDWKALAKNPGTLVFFMGVKNLKSMCLHLINAGYDADRPAVVIQRGTLPEQKVVEGTVRTIAARAAKEKLVSPALTVIGEVTKFRKKLEWFEPANAHLKLWGKTVLVTRPKSQSSGLKNLLEQHGAEVLEFPSIDILPPKNWAPLDKAVKEIKNFDWIIFTSVHGVQFFMERLKKNGKDARDLAGLKIAAIGTATGESLLSSGIHADFIPEKFTSKAMVAELKRRFLIEGGRFLLPRTDIAPQELCSDLKRSGAQVTQVVAYRTVKAADSRLKKTLRDSLWRKKIDAVTFTSASTVKNFFEGLSESIKTGMKDKKIRMISIGPVTSDTLKTYGFKPYREAKEHTVQGIVETLIQ